MCDSVAGMPSLARRGAFVTSALVLALCLWASGAPSVLYPVYAAEWQLTPVITTSVFGTYPLALLLTLLLFGSFSDAVGRRRAMLLGVALIAASAVLFAIAPDVLFLFLGRVLQGVGTGFALSAASASLVENSVFRSPRASSSAITVSTSSGLTLALVVTGVLAQHLPLPTVLSFGVLFAIAALAIVLLALMPRTPGSGAPFRVSLPHLAPGIARPFAAAALSVATAFAVGALFLSLGAQMAKQFAGTSDLTVIGLLLGVSSVTIGVTALLIARIHAAVSIAIGAVLSLAGLGVMVAAAASGSLALFFVWCVVGGVGYSFAFTGGLALANRAAPPQHRGGTLSLAYLVSYLAQAAVSVGAGALATALGLARAIDVAAPVVAAICLASLVVVLIDIVAGRRMATVATA